ncbi:MAG TPA: O-antigen ligase family protein, partial [Clostridia bacterium]|nr:O-antigen ligase family protein [Clostridia bacterium]
KLRASAIYVVLSTIIFAFLSVFVGLFGMSRTGLIAMLPLASLIIMGCSLAFVLNFAEKFSLKVAALNGKHILILVLTFIVIISTFIVAALNISKPYSYDASNPGLRRSVALEAGEYELNIKTSDLSLLSNVTIHSQSYYQASTGNITSLFNGPIEDNTTNFTVPDDSNICFIYIHATEGATITKLTILDMHNHVVKKVKPDYLFVPSFMVNRLQGIMVNSNAALRITLFQDGMKIAAMSPLIGHGPGAFESNLLSVQAFKFETRSAHNHYIQTLDEVGIIGLLAFISIFLFSYIILIRKFRSAENRLLYGTLFSMLIMITLHNAVEVNFIYGVYNIIAFMVFAIISAEFGQRKLTSKELKQYMPIPKLAKYLTLGICVLALLINIGQFASIQNVKKASVAGDTLKFLDALSLGTMLDFSNDASYKTSFLNAFSTGLPEKYQEQANDYASDIEKHNSFSSLSELVNYYIKTGNNEKAYQTLNNRQKLLRYDTDSWNATFDFYRAKFEEANLLENNESEVMLVKKYARAASDQLKSYLETSPKNIALSKENEEFRTNQLGPGGAL